MSTESPLIKAEPVPEEADVVAEKVDLLLLVPDGVGVVGVQTGHQVVRLRQRLAVSRLLDS